MTNTPLALSRADNNLERWGNPVNIKEQIADAAIRWARAKNAEGLKDERKMQSATLDRNDQDHALAEIRRLVKQLP